MSTTTRTQATNQFDPGSMGVFSGLSGAFGQGIMQDINDPYRSMAFNTQLGMQRRMGAQQQGQANQALLQRAQALGMNPNSPAFQSMMAQQQRQGMATQAGGYNQLLLQAAQLRQQALGAAGSYRPLQTGQTQVQSQGGLGSWLPQVAGGAIGGFGMLKGMGAFGGPSAGGGGDQFAGAGYGPNYTPGQFATPMPQDPGAYAGQSPFMP